MTKKEFKKLNIDFRGVGEWEDEEGNMQYDEYYVEFDTEDIKDRIKELFPKGAHFKGEYKYSNYRGGELKQFDLKYTTEKLIEIMQTEGPRDALPMITEGKLMLPMEDLGGGIVTHLDLEFVGEL